MSKILIAGGTGFVGQNTAKFLADAGHYVIVTTRKDKDDVAEHLRQYSDLITIAKVDLSQKEEVNALFSGHKIDGMVMLAQTHQAASSRNEINAVYPIVLNCLEGARANGVKRAVLGSSIAVYGGTEPPFSETAAFNPVITYTERTPFRSTKFEIRVKRIIEQLFLDYAEPMGVATSGTDDGSTQHELEVAILRLPMQFGPGYRYAGNPLALACHAAAGKIDDLANTRGYVGAPVPLLWKAMSLFRPLYIKDTASAIQAALEAPELPNTIYNVTSGFSRSARKQYQAVLAAAPSGAKGLNIPLEILSDAEPDIGFDSQRMAEDFGWKPSYTLETACEDYVKWLADNDV